MKREICLPTCLTLLLLGLAGPSSEASETAPAAQSCEIPRTHTLAKSRYIRVYFDGRKGRQHYFVACLRGDGRRLALDHFVESDKPDYVESFLPFSLHHAPIVTAGRYVAFVGSDCAAAGDCLTRIRLVDVRRGRLVHELNTGHSREDAFGDAYDDQVTSMTLKRNGSLAWISCARAYDVSGRRYATNCHEIPRYEVRKADSVSRTRVSASNRIAPYSLKLRPGRESFEWVERGELRISPIA